MALLMVSVVLVGPYISTPVARFCSFLIVPSLFFSVQEAFPLPLTRLIPLPLEGPLLGLLSPLSAPVATVSHHFRVQLERLRAASSSDVLLGVTEVIMGSYLWWTQT